MLQLNSNALSAMSYLAGCVSEWRLYLQLIQSPGVLSSVPVLPRDERVVIYKSCKVLHVAANSLGMVAAKAAADRAMERFDKLFSHSGALDAHRLSQVVEIIGQLIFVFGDELQRQRLMIMTEVQVRHFEAVSPFGDQVGAAFPTASFDISEASKCRAFERWTASVMHLMRVLEIGLRALARFHDVAPEANWNMVLNQIEAKTRETTKRSHGVEAEQWAAEAATHLRFVKNAWRNQASHALTTYDEERAVTIFDGARSFMQHLASNLTDD